MENNLWNNLKKDSIYAVNTELYQNHILEQYKMYVEMADRISARRNLANVFFLSLNTTLISIIGFLINKIKLIEPSWLILFPLAGVIAICIVWWWLIRSYRNLNTAKYKVIGFLEQRLPSSPYWSAEWKELGEGKDWKKYLPLTALEKYIPIVFCLLYILLGIYIICF